MKLLILFFLIPLAFAQNHEYRWIKSKLTIQSGKCYEIDKNPGSNKYIKKVQDSLCKPDLTYFTFDALKSRCFELDEKTAGKNYFSKVKTTKCRPDKTLFMLGQFGERSGCFEVDKKTAGDFYYNKVDDKSCQKDNYKLMWQQSKPSRGECFRVVNAT